MKCDTDVDEAGHFEFGGSTHMMIFQKDRAIFEEWAVNAVKHQNDPEPTPVSTIIATAIVNEAEE